MESCKNLRSNRIFDDESTLGGESGDIEVSVGIVCCFGREFVATEVMATESLQLNNVHIWPINYCPRLIIFGTSYKIM